MKSYGNIITRYDDMLYDSRPVAFNEFMSDKYNKVHTELYNNALKKYAEENYESLEKLEFQYKIIEMKNENYLFPSKILMISKQDYLKKIVDLTDYWNTNYLRKEITNIFNELLISDENKKNIEIEEINYYKGIIIFKNKFNNRKFSVNIDKIDFNPVYRNKLTNTFSYLLKNI